jgi:hypothetical protein
MSGDIDKNALPGSFAVISTLVEETKAALVGGRSDLMLEYLESSLSENVASAKAYCDEQVKEKQR